MTFNNIITPPRIKVLVTHNKKQKINTNYVFHSLSITIHIFYKDPKQLISKTQLKILYKTPKK